MHRLESLCHQYPLDRAWIYSILIHINIRLIEGEVMRTTLNIEDALLAKAAELTGIKEKTSLVRLGLEALIARESAKRLAALAGTEKQPRDDPPPKKRIITWSWLTLRFG